MDNGEPTEEYEEETCEQCGELELDCECCYDCGEYDCVCGEDDEGDDDSGHQA